MAGPLILTIGGMLVLTPVIFGWLAGISGASTKFFDYSIFLLRFLLTIWVCRRSQWSLRRLPRSDC